MLRNVDLEDLKARVPIEDYIASVLSLKKQGHHYVALCPLHNEKSPSFVVTPERGRFHCFGCNEDGDLFDFIQKTLDLDLPAAIRLVAERAGITLEESPEEQARSSLLERLYAVNAAAALRYHGLLLGPAGAGGRAYLEERGLREESWRRFGLGWAPETDRELAEDFVAAGYTAQEILTAGIMVRPKEEGPARAAFAGRLLFPVRDGRGRVCGFAARAISPHTQPKYLNTAGTPLYDKGRLLYGLDVAHEAIRAQKSAVVVEGYMDVVQAHQCGWGTVVGVGGTAITPEQFLLLGRCPSITLALDGDPSGQRAQIRAGLAGQAAFAGEHKEVAVHVALLPAQHDPDSLLRQDPAAFGQLLADAPLLIEYVYGRVLAATDRTKPAWRGAVLAHLRPHLMVLSFGLRTHYVRRLAADLEIADAHLWAELEGQEPPPTNGHTPTRRPARRGPQAPAWVPAITPGDPASAEDAQAAAWREGIRTAEEYALGVLLPCAPLDEVLRTLVDAYQPSTPALAPYFTALARGGPVPDGADAERLVEGAARWPAVGPEERAVMIATTLRRAAQDRLRLDSHEDTTRTLVLGRLLHPEDPL